MGGDKIHERIDLPDRSYSGIIKKTIKRSAEKIGFKDSKLGEVEVIISELVSNAIKYADGSCYFLFKLIIESNIRGIEIIYFDNGPGMKDPKKMLKDGISSTSGSFGEGLGAIFGLSDFCDIYSRQNEGTAILIRKFLKSKVKQQTMPEITIGAVGVATPGEELCGDNWHCIQNNKVIHMNISDGLGHGVNAWKASAKAVEIFENNFTLSASEHLAKMHEDLRKTRGGVCFIFSADYENDMIRYCGIGNISAKVISENKKISNCISFNGIVGFTLPARFPESNTSWNDRSIVIAHSDGINTRWNLKDYPGIEKHHPTLVAAVLYKNHCRNHDDAIIIILKRYKKQSHPFSFMIV